MNACGRPKRRAASVSEAATKVMTILDTPLKGNYSNNSFNFKDGRDGDDVPGRGTRDNNRTSSDNKHERSDSRREKDISSAVDRQISRERRRFIRPHARIPREVREAIGGVVDVVVTMDRCVHAAQILYTDHNYALIPTD